MQKVFYLFANFMSKTIEKETKKYEYNYKNIYVDDKLHKKVRCYAAKRGITLKWAAEELIEKGLKNHEVQV